MGSDRLNIGSELTISGHPKHDVVHIEADDFCVRLFANDQRSVEFSLTDFACDDFAFEIAFA